MNRKIAALCTLVPVANATLNVAVFGVDDEIAKARKRIYVDVKFVRPRNPMVPYKGHTDKLPSFLGVQKYDERLVREDAAAAQFEVTAHGAVDHSYMLEVEPDVHYYEHHSEHPRISQNPADFGKFRSELQQRLCSSTDGPKCYDGKFFGNEDSVFSVVPDAVIRNATNPEFMRKDPYERNNARGANFSYFNPGPVYANEHDLTSIASLQQNIYAMDKYNGYLEEQKEEKELSTNMDEMVGLITLNEAQIDRRVSKKYSGDLLNTEAVSVPTWEGKWLVSESSQFPTRKVAALRTSSGYLRFSHPVIIRSLMVEIEPTKGGKVSLVGGRRGSNTVWLRALSGSEDKVVTVDLADEYAMALQAVDELVFVASDSMKLVSVEVVAAAESERRLVFLSREGELAIDSVDEAGTKFLVSLEDVINQGFELIPRNTTADVTDEYLVHAIKEMIHNPGSVFADVQQIVMAEDKIPKKLLQQIQKHGKEIGKLLVDVNDRLPNDKKTKRKLTRYNDLLLAAWLHWIQ